MTGRSRYHERMARARQAEQEYLERFSRKIQPNCDQCGEAVTEEEAVLSGYGMEQLTFCQPCDQRFELALSPSS